MLMLGSGMIRVLSILLFISSSIDTLAPYANKLASQQQVREDISS